MRQIPVYQVDAFASQIFTGNPAAVCLLDLWLPDETLQNIALENNLSETAFLVREGEGYRLRWFTPTLEVRICGHATLASARVVFDKQQPDWDQVMFETLSGTLTVSRQDDMLEMDFPTLPPLADPVPSEYFEALGKLPSETYAIREQHGAPYVLAVYPSADEVKELEPDFQAMQANVIATAPGSEEGGIDFVSRFFAPLSGINEDPVTGSAHCTLAPYWSQRLDQTEFKAQQISKRGGDVFCRVDKDRVYISGQCRYFMEGQIILGAET